MIPEHLLPDFDPEPHPAAVVKVKHTRITVLTSRLLRIEYSPKDAFEDQPSQVFWYRKQPVPDFEHRILPGGKGGPSPEFLELTTQDLQLTYEIGAEFAPKTLKILIKTMDTTWHYGDLDSHNLKGTYRTLDNRDGEVNLESGLISRSGWAVIDDSMTLVFNQQGWLEPRKGNVDHLDLYFFGYGHDYQACIRDFRAIAGTVPLLPRWVLGNWWSRYWEYNQNQVIALIQEFQDREIPISVFIIDMDWHITQTGNQSTGWTGYTWNRDLFPDPKSLIRHIHERGLKTALNLHPAEGIHSHEEQYADFAREMGIDPETEQPIPFDLADPQFAKAYFELLHHPQEEAGLDFWWIDWQQGTLSSQPGLDPLWWLNHLHFLDLARPRTDNPKESRKRPFIFSRWGGLGNHRYPIGFSGDTVVSWESLAYQPYFTATAANVCYGWWSHDIGGHMSGIEDPELYTRWVQFGLLSPILRLHSTKNPFHERRPFAFDAEISRLTSQAMRLRHAFIPYLYTMAWRDHSESVSPIQPLYYLDPESSPAYYSPDTYTYGSELIAAPHTEKLGDETRLSRRKIWLPKGSWYDFFTGEKISEGHHVIYGDLNDIPLYAKSGAIIPMTPLPTWGGTETPNHLKIHVFPGNDNHFEFFDDDGNTTGYLKGEYALTPMILKGGDKRVEFTIGPAGGDLKQWPKTRTFEIKFRGITEPDGIILEINKKLTPVFPEYNPRNLTLTLPIDNEITPKDQVRIELHKNGGLQPTRDDQWADVLVQCNRLIRHFRLESYTKLGLQNFLPVIIQNPGFLIQAKPALSDDQLRAFLEIITRTGVHRIEHIGDDYILLWNENPLQDSFPVTYSLSVHQIFSNYFDNKNHYEGGPVPKFRVFHPPTQFGNNPWELRVNYGTLLTIKLSSKC